jgi:hypothetical protein
MLRESSRLISISAFISSASVSIRQHPSAYVSICQQIVLPSHLCQRLHIVSIRQHPSAYVSRESSRLISISAFISSKLQEPSACVSIRQHSQHTSAYVSIRQHT